MRKTVGAIYRKALPLSFRLFIRQFLESRPERLNGGDRLDRRAAAFNYLKGEGIEIGALHLPLAVPPSAKVKYVDRMEVADLKRQYPELNEVELVNTDIIDDGELLNTISDESQDFVIANHFIEHCQNPFLALSNMFRVLKPGGILYLAIPDKRYTFDRDRPVTSVEHVIADYEQGPAWSRRQHFEEWARFVNKLEDDSQINDRANELLEMDYSIHYHVWTQAEMFEFLAAFKKTLELAFDIELFLKYEHECIFILRKD